jgi:3'(2'),5'-bisphosphate nucleotidase
VRPSPPVTLDLERLLAVTFDAARRAGEAIMEVYAGDFAVSRKADASPVTLADQRAETIILAALAAAAPGIPVVAEEQAEADGLPAETGDLFWLVDPLDGTKEFIQHIPEFCVCIALTEDGYPVVAVEYNPAADRLYVAVRGEGTTVNGTRVHVSATSSVPDAVVMASRSEDKRHEWDVFKPHCRVQLTGSVAYKLAELATGNGDATFTLTPKNEWDICAGTLLVEEAGGRVTDIAGKRLAFNQPDPLRPGMIATNGVLHDGLLALIAEVAPGLGLRIETRR